MEAAKELNALLDALEQDPNGNGPFVGYAVSEAVRRAKYPYAWRPLIERYIQLVGENKKSANVRLYCDLMCTVVSKKLFMTDMFYVYDRDGRSRAENEKSFREAHTAVATMYLAKMISCACECIHGRAPASEDAVRIASLLYAELYAAAFDTSDVREQDVFRLVQEWFCRHVSRDKQFRPVNVAPGFPFLLCSHVYWLWLHLTAGGVRHCKQDLLTIVYALDTIVYCDECRTHFLNHRPEFFVDDRDGGGCFCRVPNDELLLRVHNATNALTGRHDMDGAILKEYEMFWQK